MRRVAVIHATRRSLRPAFRGPLICVAALGVLNFAVSVSDVVANMSSLSAFDDYVRYVALAFAHTTVFVQAVLLVAFAAALWFATDLIRARSRNAAFSA